MIKQPDTRALLSLFFRYGRLFLIILIPVVLLAIIYLLFTAPAYESTAELLVKFGRAARPEISSAQDMNNDSADEHRRQIQSDVRILTSRDLAQALLGDMTVAKIYPDIARNPPASGTVMDAALKRFHGDLKVKTENDSDMISVGIYNHNPEVAAAELNHFLGLFVTRQAQIYTNPQTAALQQQAANAYQQLLVADRNLHDYMAKTGIVSVDEQLKLLLDQRGDIADYLARRPMAPGAAAGGAQSIAYNHASGATPSGLSAIPARIPVEGADRFPVLDDVQRKIDDLRARETDLLQTYRPDSEVIRNIQQNIQDESAAQNASVGALGHQIASLDRQIADQQSYRPRYEALLRTDQIAADLYKDAEKRAEIAKADNDLNQRKITQISVIENPSVPYTPARPKKLITLGFSLLIGTAFSLAAMIAAAKFDRSFTMPEQVVDELGVPVIASFGAFRPVRRAASITSINQRRG